MGGLFGVVSDNCVKTLFYGTDYHSHLGTENAGLAVYDEGRFFHVIHRISHAQFKSRFLEDYRTMKGTMGIGAIDDESPQPLLIRSKFGVYALAATGLVTNKDELAQSLLKEGATFGEMADGGINTVELVAKLINRGETIAQGIIGMQKAIEGSICVLLLAEEGIYAARDRLGRFPLVIGKDAAGGFVVATESSSFINLGYDQVHSLGPGEITLLDGSQIKTLRPSGTEMQICAFLWIYTGYPASVYEGVNVENARERCGRAMARLDNVDADFVTGVPDSGVGHAIGYAIESGLPFRRPLIKYTPGYGRSYTPPSQEIRDLVATMKLSAIRDVIAGQRMVVCEDSIVRGTQLKNYTIRKLWENGAREIHIRPACPPLMFPCRYASSTRSITELASYRAIKTIEGGGEARLEPYLDHTSKKYDEMVELIRRDLDVTSLRYLPLEEMIAAIGLPEERLCLHCWRGR